MRKGLRMIAVIALGAAPLAPAARVWAQCATSTFLEIDVPGVGTFYYDDRSEYPPVPGDPQLYEESNGEPGIQRAPRPWWDVLELTPPDEVCVESQNPDKRWL